MHFSSASCRVLFFCWVSLACTAWAETVTPEQAEARALAVEMRSRPPQSDLHYRATLELRNTQGQRTRIPLVVETRLGVTNGGWVTRYQTLPGESEPAQTLVIVHDPAHPPRYRREATAGMAEIVPAQQSTTPLFGSDFWLGDLGLEFLHWPDQRLIPAPRGNPLMIKGRACKMLESRNPSGIPYSRVVSWVDNEFRSLIQADAYDASGKLLKRFGIGSFKKVDGVWLLKDMEMIDEQKETKTKLEFELKVAE